MSAKAAVVEPEAASPAVVGTEKFPLTHKGFGKYEVNGVIHPNKELALQAQAQLVSHAEAEEVYGDIIPEGVDIKVTDRSLVYRGSLLEVPMNEVFLPTGEYNPMYDRAWTYAWAARTARGISAYRAVGYELFTYETLEAMVIEGTAPPHYLSLLQRDGEHLVYGDLVLMRTPRVRWRQRKAEQEAKLRAKSEKLDKQLSDAQGYGPAFPGESIDLEQ